MIKYLYDPANAITFCGLLCSAVAMNFALNAQIDYAIVFGLWAMLADQLDGIVASRTKNRAAEFGKMGKSLDGFADLVYGAVLPALIVLQLGDGTLLASALSVAMVAAGALRLSYFNNFGLSSTGYFTGVPLSYDIPLLAALQIAGHMAPGIVSSTTVVVAFSVLVLLHISPLQIPAPGRLMYRGISAYALAATCLLLAHAYGLLEQVTG